MTHGTISSMTGFASLEKETPFGVLVFEMRSVNHRYLELHLKLDDNVRIFEPLVRELMTSKLGRGKAECRVSLMPQANQAKQALLNTEVLQTLVQLEAQAQQHFPRSAPLTTADILRWPGVIQTESCNQAILAEAMQEGLTQVLADMTASRQREGAKLKTIILERLHEMEDIVAKVKPLLPMQVKAYQARLTEKMLETLKTLDEDRMRQEVVLFAQKIDVDEELTRLVAHIAEVKRILDKDTSAGKRLDFLMQELNREANTLGSKSVSTEVSQASMGLKILIEQMREQIQNIE